MFKSRNSFPQLYAPVIASALPEVGAPGVVSVGIDTPQAMAENRSIRLLSMMHNLHG